MTTSEMTPDRAKAARELLAFYLEAGVDALVAETPVDHLVAEAPPAPGPATTTLASAPIAPTPSCPDFTGAADAGRTSARCTRDRSACARHRRDGSA
jgi:hypothetical protein